MDNNEPITKVCVECGRVFETTNPDQELCDKCDLDQYLEEGEDTSNDDEEEDYDDADDDVDDDDYYSEDDDPDDDIEYDENVDDDDDER